MASRHSSRQSSAPSSAIRACSRARVRGILSCADISTLVTDPSCDASALICWPIMRSSCESACITVTPLSNFRIDIARPSGRRIVATSTRSSGEISSIPRARLKIQYTSGRVIIPPASLSLPLCVRKSASCRANCWWYSVPAEDRVTGLRIPIFNINSLICSLSPSFAPLAAASEVTCALYRSMTDTTSRALPMSAFRSVKASSASFPVARRSCSCFRISPDIPALEA
mmetsp:Transcript_39960/g.91897  ORF Transcript_39960/g.91897 Transcript_39960/m.91897 type:complete len:228 (+) Transcript_39960:200-883(+)